MFGTGTKIRAFQYIPITEDFVIRTAGRLSLESTVGPFQFHVKGAVTGTRQETFFSFIIYLNR